MFPPCDFSGHVKPNGRRYCRLTNPAKIVPLSACVGCQFAGQFTGRLEPIITPDRSQTCTHRGAETRRETCQTCQGNVQVKVFACDKHKECTIESKLPAVRGCSSCGDYQPPPVAVPTFPPLSGPANLMMFFYPKRTTREVRERQQEVIRESISKFDGRKLCAVAYDDSTDESAIDCSLFDEVHMLPNDPTQWELPGWRWAMGRLKDQPGFTVRLHAKGASRGVQEQHLAAWWEIGFETLLDVDAVRTALQTAKVCGPFRLNQPAANLGVPWIFAGSFYAFRHDLIFSQPWEPPSKSRPDHYVEAWPALVAKREESACLAYDGVSVGMYEARNWRPVPDANAEIPQSKFRVQLPPQPVTIEGVTNRTRKNETEIPLEIPRPPRHAAVSFRVTEPPPVAIVIAGRNNSQYLAEAIETSLNQSVPCEVVYADDCSTDDSVKLAMGYLSSGLRVLPSGVHRGVCDARNRGANATKAPYLIHLDSDDRLPTDFAQCHIAAMQAGTPFVYGPAQAFGDKDVLWGVPAWEEYDLWRHNTVNTSAMYARWAFDAAGGWQDSSEVPTMWDFDLAIRASRFGTPRPSKAVLDYRQHANGYSHSIGETEEDTRITFAESIRRKNAKVCIASLVGPRLPGIFPRWLDAVRSSALFAHLPTPPALLLLCHNADAARLEQISAAVAGCSDVFSSVQIQLIQREMPDETETARRNGVAALLADACSRMQTTSTADLLWLIEDDILVPRAALKKLFHEATAGSVPPIAVSGVYLNRHTEIVGKRSLGGMIKGGKHVEPPEHPATVSRVDFAGSGCLMFWANRPGTPRVWRSHCAIEPQPAADFAWCESAKGVIRMHGGVRCGHAKTETEILQA